MESVFQQQIDNLVQEVRDQAMQQTMLTIAAAMMKLGVSRMTLTPDDIDRAARSFIIADEQEDGSWEFEIHPEDLCFSKSLPPFHRH